MSFATRPTAAVAPSNDLLRAAIEGLSLPQKALPCYLFYDARGSALFERITELPEYYPTRTETAILAARVGEIAAQTPPGSILVEFGSGSSRKTEILIDALPTLAAYVPIDVSRSALDEACARLASRFPALRIIPTEGDFTQPLILPQGLAKRPRLGFFPGSTIGNFGHDDACALLRGMALSLGTGARLLIGADLQKDLARLIPAYNDSAGVTAEFNLNLLARLNREIGANFDLERFGHAALFNAVEGRIEIYLVSLAAQTVDVGGRRFDFAKGERIHTENSYKYTIAQFGDLASRAGWAARHVWTDAENLFSLFELALAH
ncbi:L-histidine N(alpha)-methyltransferase [Methylocapsa polymorpha]|uniref:L-histidine N(Alpha)-methyltransferase n=1 Tax=Methylocapsa polymorpha TaxID=3080828 RepID=A0ABZ0HXV2_9HYPH|nr:L-histidine N(alpha)-methyltransferase [Methylocapsa sp. RX1]